MKYISYFLYYLQRKNNNRISDNDINKLLFILSVIAVELLFYIFLDNELIHYLLYISIVAVSFVLNAEYIFYLILFILPNQRLFVFPGTPYSLVNIILFIYLIKYIVRNKRLPKKQLIFPILIVLYAVFTTIFIQNFSNVIFGIKSVVLILAFLLYINSYKYKISRIYVNILLFYVIGCITASILAFYFNPDFMIGTKMRFEGGSFNNSNIFGFNLSFAISVLLYLLVLTKKHVLRYLSLIFILFLFGLLTQSRSFYFSIIFMILFISVFNFFLSDNKKSQGKIILVLFLLVGVVIYYIISNPDSVIGEMFYSGWKRIVTPRKGDISGNRIFLWVTYVTYLFQHHRALLFGIGSINIESIVDTINVAHNFIIEVVVSWGIIGLFLFISYFVYIWKNIKRNLLINDLDLKLKNRSHSIIGYLPLLVLLITGMTGHNFLGNAFLVKFFLSILAIIYDKNYSIVNEKNNFATSYKGCH